VVLSDINLKAAERVASEIAASGGRASAFEQDTASPEDSEKVVSHAVDTYGALHYAVNNAGASAERRRLPVRRISPIGIA
jgi:NAD(P)-dependent dehydrogenase (short-subunit alcohol dehydrogenase family)